MIFFNHHSHLTEPSSFPPLSPVENLARKTPIVKSKLLVIQAVVNHPGNFVPDTFFLPLAILPRTEYLNATDRLSSVSGFKRLPPVL
jgi:hypothetical protein